jgi:hypothetical protein
MNFSHHPPGLSPGKNPVWRFSPVESGGSQTQACSAGVAVQTRRSTSGVAVTAGLLALVALCVAIPSRSFPRQTGIVAPTPTAAYQDRSRPCYFCRSEIDAHHTPTTQALLRQEAADRFGDHIQERANAYRDRYQV